MGGCVSDVTQLALRRCKERSKGIDCKVYAENGVIIWKGAANEGAIVEDAAVEIGQGQIELSYSVEQAWNKYLDFHDPLYFAVTNDGTGYSYIYCTSTPCVSSEKLDAIESCQRRTGGRKCYLYAVGRKIVWKKTQNLKVQN